MATYGATRPNSNQSQSAGTTSQATNTTTRGSTNNLFNKPVPPEKLKVPQKDLLIFFRQMSVILESGVPLAQGMLLIAENMTNPRLAHCIQRISLRLNAGEELSSSLQVVSRGP